MVRQRMPWNTRVNLFDVVCQEMDDFVGRLQDPAGWNEGSTSFAPRTNVAETESHFEITMDLPGMSDDEFNIELHEGKLTVSGARKSEEVEEGKTYHRVERHRGEFKRTFALQSEVDVDNVAAEYTNGVLVISIPKVAKAQPTKINVKS